MAPSGVDYIEGICGFSWSYTKEGAIDECLRVLSRLKPGMDITWEFLVKRAYRVAKANRTIEVVS